MRKIGFYLRGIFIFTLIFPVFASGRNCKIFKKNVAVKKLLTACQLAVNGSASVCGDLFVSGRLNVASGVVGPIVYEYAQYSASAEQTVLLGGTNPVVFQVDDIPSLGITRDGTNPTTTFILPSVGIYEVSYYLSVDARGQAGVRLNGVNLGYTVIGVTVPDNSISTSVLVQTIVPNSTLQIVNPSTISNLVISQIEGGSEDTPAKVMIRRIR